VIEPLSKLSNGEFTDPKDEEDKFNYIKAISTRQITNIIKIIDERIGENNTTEGQILILKRLLSEIEWQISQLDMLPILNGTFIFFKNDLNLLKSQLLFKYQYLTPEEKANEKPIIPNSNKIQWVGNINLLTTLFYDLLNGQVKGIGKNKITTPPLIKAQKKDIAKLLAENFIDVNAEPLKETTLSDYLSKSENKSSSKLPSGSRIELPEK
jgi:hypothetical protein